MKTTKTDKAKVILTMSKLDKYLTQKLEQAIKQDQCKHSWHRTKEREITCRKCGQVKTV